MKDCPGCGTEGFRKDTFADRYDCDNEDCRVEVFR